MTKSQHTPGAEYWDDAGRVGYAEAMFRDPEVERHINGRLWHESVQIGGRLGLTARSHVLDLGCGDGAFANRVLARHYEHVDGLDVTQAAIERARDMATGSHLRFEVADLTNLRAGEISSYDGAFLMGILHHVKEATPRILQCLAARIPRLVILEPNGNHLARRLLELTPSYRAAGEESFRASELETQLDAAGYTITEWHRLNLFPNFTPRLIFRLLRPIEPFVEGSALLKRLCTVNLIGATAKDAI